MSDKNRKFLFTSESVTEGHPDKIADQISDAVLDAVLTADPTGRVACETPVTTGLVMVAGEIITTAVLDSAPSLLAMWCVTWNATLRAKFGFDAETCAVISSLHRQSPDIAMGVDTGGAGDQGLMFGFACDETEELMPLADYPGAQTRSAPFPGSPPGHCGFLPAGRQIPGNGRI